MTPTTEMPTVEVLRHAAGYLRRYGWTFGVRYELPHPDAPHPAADIVGAVRIVVTGHPVLDEYADPEHAVEVGRALGALAAFLELGDASAAEALTEWNDAVPVNTGEVVAVLLRAADWHEAHTAAYAATWVARQLGSAAGR